MNPNQTSGIKRTEEQLINPLILKIDCWLLICQHLDLEDIVNLSKISPTYKQLVGKYLLPMQFTNLDISLYNIDLNDVEFILESVRNTVKKLVFHFRSCDKELEFLTRFSFPCVTELFLPRRRIGKDEMYDLSLAFPSLRSLKNTIIRIDAVMKIVHFKHLKNLSLTFCERINVCEFQDLLIALNLKSLTINVFGKSDIKPLKIETKRKLRQLHYLELNSFELNWLSDGGANKVYKDLKTLKVGLCGVCGVEDIDSIHNLFSNIDYITSRNVNEIKISNGNDNFLLEFMVPEKYDFLNRVNTLKFDGVTCVSPGAPNRYKALRELGFYNFHYHSESWPNILWNIFSNAEELELLSFEGELGEHVLNDKHLKALMVRKKPITLNWNTGKNLPPEFCSEKFKGLIRFTQKSYIHPVPMFDTNSYITIQFES